MKKLALTILSAISLAGAVYALECEILEEQIYQSVNRERERLRIPALVYDDALENVARMHASNMIRFGFIDHVDQEGRSVGERVATLYPDLVGGFGENIGVYTLQDEQALCARIVNGWAGSTAHSVNLYSKDYTITGVASVVSNGMAYAVQVFGTVVGDFTSLSPSSPRTGDTAEVSFRFLGTFPRRQLEVYVAFPNPRAQYRSPDGRTYLGGGYFPVQWFAGFFSVSIPLNYGKGFYTVYAVRSGMLYPNGYRFEVK